VAPSTVTSRRRLAPAHGSSMPPSLLCVAARTVVCMPLQTLPPPPHLDQPVFSEPLKPPPPHPPHHSRLVYPICSSPQVWKADPHPRLAEHTWQPKWHSTGCASTHLGKGPEGPVRARRRGDQCPQPVHTAHTPRLCPDTGHTSPHAQRSAAPRPHPSSWTPPHGAPRPPRLAPRLIAMPVTCHPDPFNSSTEEKVRQSELHSTNHSAKIAW
jgi:hypothetical protein